MEKKSLVCIGAGVMLILAAVFAYVGGAVAFEATMFFGRKGRISFRIFQDEWFMEMYKSHMTFMDWANIILLAVAGVLMLVKAFMPDLLPSVVIGGVFALLAVVALIALFKNVGNLFHAGGFKGFLRILIYLFMNVLSVAAFGVMAAIALMKDSFGNFFFVPAAAMAVNAVISAFMGLTGLFGAMKWAFGSLILFFMFDMMLVMALFAAGMAIKEN